MNLPLPASVAILLVASASVSTAENWPQFRGVNGSSRATSHDRLPDEIGPSKNVIWKTELPPGHSSPVIFDDLVFLTAARGERLFTIALRRVDGKVIWEREAATAQLEKVHRIGSYAQASCAADRERVVSFFGSCGLFCYTHDGRLLWRREMGPFNNDFGAAISPIIVGDRVILCQDHDTDSYIAALNKQTGETIWRTDRSEFPRNYCTPVVVEVEGKKQLVVAGTLRVVAYDFETGREVWTVRGISRAACSSPAIDDKGVIYISSWAGGGEPGARITVAPFGEVHAARDRNKNDTLEEVELEKGGAIQRRFSQVDRDKSGGVTRQEYEYFRGLFQKSRNVLLAIRPGGSGDVTEQRVLWEFTKFVPFVASPVYSNGCVFAVKDGGILSSLDAETGRPLKTKRLPGTGAYYSSPVAADGRIFLLNQQGKLTIVSAERQWRVLSKADFAEDVYATPAVVAGRIYLRTRGGLYCFGEKP